MKSSEGYSERRPVEGNLLATKRIRAILPLAKVRFLRLFKRSRSLASSSRLNSNSSPGNVATISGRSRRPIVIRPTKKDAIAKIAEARTQTQTRRRGRDVVASTTEGLTACCAHVTRRRRRCVPSDDKVVALGLPCDCSTNCVYKWSIKLRAAQRLPQISRVLLTEAHVEGAGARDPNAITALAEIVRERRYEIRCDRQSP